MENEKQADRFTELLTWLMNVPDGREFVYSILNAAGVNRPNYVVTATNYMAYEIGRRSLGDELLQRLRSDVEDGFKLEMLMRQEARARPRKKREEDFYDQFEGGES